LSVTVSAPAETAIVTGASQGIGRAVARALAAPHRSIVVTYLSRREDAEALADELAPSARDVLIHQVDVRDPKDVDELMQIVDARYGRLDILVNNAGITADRTVARMSDDQWRIVLETNLFGAFYTTKAVMRPMLKARAGRIVNITSVSGQAGNAGQANYSSAKAGLIGLTKATAREVASRGITCNAVAPGFVLTELTSSLPDNIQEGIKTATPLGRFGTAEEVSAAVAFLASDEASYITGQVLAVDGGLVMM